MKQLINIYDNSLRLLDDAVHMLERERFSTATALAIFSIEESAKFVIKAREAVRDDLTRKKVYKHEVKHEEIGDYFWYWAIYSVLTDTFADFKKFVQEKGDKKTMEVIEHLQGGEAVDFLRFHMFKDETELKEFVKERFRYPAYLEISESAKSGEIEKLRRRCLYVDLSNDYTLISDPREITKDEAEYWVMVARFGLMYMQHRKDLILSAQQNATPGIANITCDE